jgi:hypothetical protein
MTSCVHKMCERTYGQTNMKRAKTLAKINHPWNRYNMCMLRSKNYCIIIPPLAEWWVYWNTLVRPSVRPSLNHVYVTSHLFVTCWILFIFGVLAGHDLSMHILYRFHGWLIFARVIALFMFVWPYVRSHILCMQLVICLLSHFIHIWYLDWPWSEHAPNKHEKGYNSRKNQPSVKSV